MSVNDYARVVHEEILAFRFILFALHEFIESRCNNVSRASMIDMDHVTNILLGSMYTILELEREVKRLESKPGALRRVLWAVAGSGLVSLVQRLQNHNGTINSMLSILTRYVWHDTSLPWPCAFLIILTA